MVITGIIVTCGGIINPASVSANTAARPRKRMRASA